MKCSLGISNFEEISSLSHSVLFLYFFALIASIFYEDFIFQMSLNFSGKESAYSAGAARVVGLIPGLGRSPGGGHGNPLQYSCLKNPVDREA